MSDHETGIVAHILTIVSMTHGLLSCLISLTVLIIIADHYYRNRLEPEQKTALVLSVNTYVFIFIYVTMLVSFTVQTLIGDTYGLSFDSVWCKCTGYAANVISFAMFHAFSVQALYRLFRIVYTKYRWLQSFRLYIVVIPVQLVTGMIFMSPLLVWNNILYLPNDFYCFVPFSKVEGILFVVFMCYLFPISCMSLAYIRITRFLRQQTNVRSLVTRRRQERDVRAIQRLFINVALLLTAGLPGFLFLIVFLITGVPHPLNFRVAWVGIEISLTVLSVTMTLMTPQLKKIVLTKLRLNRTNVVKFALPMRPMTMTVQ